uniref:peptidase U32 family protein n=1 Tax=Eubacterium cellulosolvens TaxID=29322 RepID=UPI00047F262C|nr:U32 family peptidase [[Eubacterium] cellulosolvens]
MRTELLAPAGSIEALQAAYMAGADAVYIGGSRFGARAYASNPDEKELCAAIDLAHRLGKKIYMTVNTLLRDEELENELYAWMKPYVEAGLHGAIIQDFGVVDLFAKAFPELELHASTQMTVTGVHGAKFLKEIGMHRIVPARELTLGEIAKIHRETGMEIEAFAHGAMCYSFSGQCLMSSLIGGRSGNRGRCAGVCRLPFDVTENGRRMNAENTHYPLNMKDMCTVEILPEMIRAGVYSFKIEGRMKKPEYTAGVVSVYRKYLDLCAEDPENFRVDPEDYQKLLDLFNRDGFNRGCYYDRNGRNLIALKNEKMSNSRALTAQKLTEEIRAGLHDRANLQKLQAGVSGNLYLAAGQPAVLTVMPDLDETGELCCSVQAEGVQPAQKQAVTEERVRAQLNKTGGSSFFFSRLDIQMEDGLFVPMQLLNELRREAFALLEEKFRSQASEEVRPCPPLPSPDAGSDSADSRSASGGDNSGEISGNRKRMYVSVETPDQLRAVSKYRELDGVYLSSELLLPSAGKGAETWKKMAGELLSSGQEVRLMLPYMLRDNSEEAQTKAIREYCSFVDERGAKKTILVRNLEELGLVREIGEGDAVMLDAGFYTMNTRTERFFASLGYADNTMPLELNYKEMRARENERSELIVYGRAPMMISAHCLKKTLDHCAHENTRLVMRDRKGAAFPAECHCDACYNIIYNSLPTSLLQEKEACDRLAVPAVRLQFTVESAQEASMVTEAFVDSWKKGETETAENLSKRTESTKGHFRRGVE